MKRTLLARQRGFTLVEMGIALLVLGVVAVGMVGYWRMAGQQRVAVAERDILAQAQQAALGFAHANNRLPCPAVNNDGVESCGIAASPNQVGFLPWRTMQLPGAAGMALKYGVYRAPQTNGWLDVDLAVARDRMRPLATTSSVAGIETADEVLLNSSNLADFCLALSLGAEAPATATTLAVQDAGQATATRRPMAFVIAAPGLLDADGNGNPFDGLNQTAGNASPTFEAGNRAVTDTYDDRVLGLGFDTLFSQLQCGQALSAIQHSHFNAALSASTMKRAISDYHYQLQVEALLAGATVASATAGVSLATAGVANGVAAVSNATSFTVITYGSTAGLIAAATAALVVNTAALVASAAPLALSIAVTVEAAERVSRAATMMTTSSALAESININARTADALGY